MINVDDLFRGVAYKKRPILIRQKLKRKRESDMADKEKWNSGRKAPKLDAAVDENFRRLLVFTDREEVREMDYVRKPLGRTPAEKKAHWEEPDGSIPRCKILYWREMPEEPQKAGRK